MLCQPEKWSEVEINADKTVIVSLLVSLHTIVSIILGFKLAVCLACGWIVRLNESYCEHITY